MKSIRRVIAGRKAKIVGEKFENYLKSESYRQGWEIIRIPDGCKQVSASKTIRIRTPFDFIFHKTGKIIFADAKTTKKSTFNHSQITIHQVQELYKLECNGYTAGYIINFSEKNLTEFYRASKLLDIYKSFGSIKPEMGIPIGNNSTINIDNILLNGINGKLAEF